MSKSFQIVFKCCTNSKTLTGKCWGGVSLDQVVKEHVLLRGELFELKSK